MADLTVIRFRYGVSPYQAGETAGFTPAEAKRYLDAGAADYVSGPVPAGREPVQEAGDRVAAEAPASSEVPADEPERPKAPPSSSSRRGRGTGGAEDADGG